MRARGFGEPVIAVARVLCANCSEIEMRSMCGCTAQTMKVRPFFVASVNAVPFNRIKQRVVARFCQGAQLNVIQ